MGIYTQNESSQKNIACKDSFFIFLTTYGGHPVFLCRKENTMHAIIPTTSSPNVQKSLLSWCMRGYKKYALFSSDENERFFRTLTVLI
jgi:hypothetical protein